MSQTSARTIQITRYGSPEVLAWTTVALAPLKPGEVRIRTIAAAVNHTDLEIRAGNWPVRKHSPFPYVPGVEVVGTIEEVGAAVSQWMVGQTVITMMQGLGGVRAERDSGYAELVTVGAEALAPVPPSVDPLEMAAFGLVGVTAYWGLQRFGTLEGKRIIVTGAAGGVGSAAVAFARAQGASVVGIVARPEQAAYVHALGADQVEIAARNSAPALTPEIADGVLDVIGGALFGICVNALRDGGVLSLVGAVAGGDVAFDAWQLTRPVTLTGYSTETLDGAALGRAVADISGWLSRGEITAPDHQTVPMQYADRAHALLERGGVRGRVLLLPTADRGA